MKKSLKIFLTCLFLCPLLILTACQSPAQYSITTNPSDSSLGSIPESSEINLNKKMKVQKLLYRLKKIIQKQILLFVGLKIIKKLFQVKKILI